jgi:hypothetical protein
MRMRPVSLWSARGKEAVSCAFRPTRCHGVPHISLTVLPSSAALALPHGQGAPRLDS